MVEARKERKGEFENGKPRVNRITEESETEKQRVQKEKKGCVNETDIYREKARG